MNRKFFQKDVYSNHLNEAKRCVQNCSFYRCGKSLLDISNRYSGLPVPRTDLINKVMFLVYKQSVAYKNITNIHINSFG